jgi:SAM-dependent methyltransferase
MLYQKNKRPYDKLSLIYDGLMKDVNFNLWTEYVMDIASNYANTASSFLELAAGNCTNANNIKKKYSNLIATDISLPMLKSHFQSDLLKVCCNMISLPFKKKFDFVYATFDSINYLLTQKELQFLFKEIEIFLNENGIFTFDASLENNSLEFTNVQVTKDRYNGFSFKRLNSYDKKTRIHKNVFYIYDKSGVEFKEVHKQKIYSFETFFNLIDKAGLVVKECYDGFTFKDGGPKSERVQFVIGKRAA